MKKLNILITRFPFESRVGGEEFHTLHLAQKMVKKGHCVTLFSSDSILRRLFREGGLKAVSGWGIKPPVTAWQLLAFTVLSPIYFVYFGWFLYEFRRGKENLVLYALSLPEKLLMSPIAKLLGFNVVWVEHARIERWLTKNPWIVGYRLWARFSQIIAPSSQTVAPISWAKNIRVIPHGVLFDEEKSHPTDVHTKKTHFHILCVARLSQDKGVDYLIKAVKKLINQHDNYDITTHHTMDANIKLKIVSTGPELANLKTLTNQINLTNQIEFLGKINHNELKKLYKTCDVSVLPSTEHDPFGLVVVESMLMKTPAIVTQVCGVAEFLENGVDAMVVPEKDEKALYQALNALLNNQDFRLEMAEAGYKAAKEKFSHDRMVEDYEKVFGNI